MPRPSVRRKTASFQTQGRLLQELGERLVAKADVALLELIKNAYDADASSCEVNVDKESVEISDDGHGMTEEDFLEKWMRIATPDKQRARLSRKYKRNVTGSKGIGRFAVRFLGRFLRLETVAKKSVARGGGTLLSVEFNWEQIDSASELHKVKIPYEVRRAPVGRQTGTRLLIQKLRAPGEVTVNKKIRTELLSLVNPYTGLDAGRFRRRGKSKADPGFQVILPETSGEGREDLSSGVLDNAYACLRIEQTGNRTHYRIRHRDGRILVDETREAPSKISKGFVADIRYFPRRAGMFRGTGVDGRTAWRWIREHWGVGIVDHGFRIRPYGFEDDDWLNLSLDSAHSRRDWRASFMDTLFPMPPEASSRPRLNPMLYLPNFHQLVGAVFVESAQDLTSRRPTDLTPSMDREGFVENEGFEQLTDLVRAGLEMLAYADHSEQRRVEEEKKRSEARELRSDLRRAAAYVRKVPGLSAEDREIVVEQFTRLSRELEDVKEYYQVATSKLELMGLLGVIAGFVTHEMQRVLNGLDRLLARLRRSLPKDRKTAGIVRDIQETRSAIVGQLDYATAFIGALQDPDRRLEPVDSKGAAGLVAHQFTQFTKDRGIEVEIEIEEGVTSPPLPRALYTGVIMNLFTNAIKATIGGPEASPDRRVSMRAWNEPKRHVFEIADSGVGIPPALQKRIWDPLFTTTSGQDYNPLGSGMGLGLALVKRVVSDAKGRLGLVDPPPGYRTCFRVEFSR